LFDYLDREPDPIPVAVKGQLDSAIRGRCIYFPFFHFQLLIFQYHISDYR